MHRPPDDRVFLLATDIERSTHWWSEHPEEMAEASARHDSALREIFTGHGGTLVPRLWEGDSAFAWFGDPSVAIAAGLDAQRMSESLCVGDRPLKLRAAIHAATLDPAGGLPGSEVSRVLKIRSVAHGGQVLVSKPAATASVEGASFIDLGWHRIATGTERIRLFQLVHEDLEEAFPPLRTIESAPNNVGVHLSSFVGRTEEKRRTRDLLSRYRRAAVCGPPGIGKTRLAREAAYELLPSFPDGAWIVDATLIERPDDVWRQLQGLVPADPRSNEMLVVVDGDTTCTMARIADELASGPVALFACCYPDGIDPSQCVQLSGLDTESQKEDTSEAACLLTDRLKDRSPDFPTESWAQVFQDIGRRVDGHPLAIEWLVSRVESLGPASLLERLTEDAPILWGGSALADRRSPLRESFDAAFAHLHGPEQDWLSSMVGPPSTRLVAAGLVAPGAGGWEVPPLVRGYLAARGRDRA